MPALIRTAAVVAALLLASPIPPAAAQPAADRAGEPGDRVPDGEPAGPRNAGAQLSPTCSAPLADIAKPGPLPHFAAALRTQRTIRVLAIGSSSTVGVGASSPMRNYPAQLEDILERTFKGLDVVMINAGVSGEVAAATAERLKRELASDAVDLVLWQVGTNDALAKVPVEDFTATVRDTVRWLKQRQVDVVLIGMQYSPRVAQDEHHGAIRRAVIELAASENVMLVRRFDAMRFILDHKDVQLIAGDGLHHNDLGYRCMAEHIARALVLSAGSARQAALPGR